MFHKQEYVAHRYPMRIEVILKGIQPNSQVFKVLGTSPLFKIAPLNLMEEALFVL
jgi:hypothetical protein